MAWFILRWQARLLVKRAINLVLTCRMKLCHPLQQHGGTKEMETCLLPATIAQEFPTLAPRVRQVPCSTIFNRLIPQCLSVIYLNWAPSFLPPAVILDCLLSTTGDYCRLVTALAGLTSPRVPQAGTRWYSFDRQATTMHIHGKSSRH